MNDEQKVNVRELIINKDIKREIDVLIGTGPIDRSPPVWRNASYASKTIPKPKQ